MNLQEQIELAFKAGTEFSIIHSYIDLDHISYPTEEEIDQGTIDYLNKVELFTEIK